MPQLSSTTTSTVRRNNNNNLRPVILLCLVIYCSYCIIAPSTAFSLSTTVSRSCNSYSGGGASLIPSHPHQHQHERTRGGRKTTTTLQNFANDDDDEEDADLENYDAAVAAQIRKARKLLKDAKKKMDPPPSSTTNEQQQQTDDDTSSSLPFFAQQSFTTKAVSNAQKIKSKTPSGSIIADGAAMTSLSNSEPWELRSLSQIGFECEARSDYDGNIVEVDTSSTSSLADKDVAMSIYNLRKTLQNEDFKSVFNSRNRFIGEVD